MDTQRLVLLFIFGFSVLMLWEAWQKDARPKPSPTAQQAAPAAQPAPGTAKPGPSPAAAPAGPGPGAEVPGAAASASAKGETVRVRTDLFGLEIDTLGGTLKQLASFPHNGFGD